MASIQKYNKKWKAFVRRKKITIVKSFLRKGDATKWAYKTEAQIETGVFKRIKDAEKLGDVRLCDILNIYFDNYVKNKSSHERSLLL